MSTATLSAKSNSRSKKPPIKINKTDHERLLKLAQADVHSRWQQYEQLAALDLAPSK